MGRTGHYLEIIDSEGTTVLGESEGRGFESCIDVVGWNWDVADQSSSRNASAYGAVARDDAGSNHVSFDGSREVGIEPSPFTFSKTIDRSTPRLMTSMYLGEVLQQATFTLREELADSELENRPAFCLHAVLEDVIIVGYRSSARSAEHRVDLDETWTFNYTRISFLYETNPCDIFFDRRPGARKRSAARREPTFVEQLRRYGIVPQHARIKRQA